MKERFLNKSILVALLSLLQATSLLAQEGHIKGRVHNGSEDLPAATVSLGNKAVLTDNNGKFLISASPGVYTLIITYTGYKKIEQVIKIEAGKTQMLDFIMTPVEQLGEIVVLGSRSVVQRSNLYTPVPVDVFSSSRLVQTGHISLTQMLNFAAPSFNASREILNEPATLRGLDPQHVLILLNGTRYHNMAWLFGGGLKGQLGKGSVGNDLNSIPFSGVEKVEILRDGAAAQYGSDAVAGVINIRLKESTGKTSIQLHTGQYYKGDGEKFSFGINRGISLNKRGFLNVSGDFRYQAPTFRGGEYQGTVYKSYPSGATRNDSILIKAQDDSIIRARGFNRRSVFENIGNSKIVRAGFLVNGGYSISNHTELFWTAAVNQRKVWRDVINRFPKNPNQVNLVLFPDGFQPKTNNNTIDVSAIAGVKGDTKNEWYWNFTSSYGQNALSSGVTNSNNASQSYLGKEAPTSFYTGKTIYQQLTNNINFTKRYTRFTGNIKSLNIAIGGEWRVENYRNSAGDSASWHNYDPSGRTQAGSQGNSGTRPEDVVNKSRNVLGTYLDLETELADRLLFDVAARYEYYSDFGSNLAGKLAARYKFSERFMLRTSVNNGFRAPSLQQRYLSSTRLGFLSIGNTLLTPAINGLFPNNHEVVKALGIPSLTAERTLNVSGGLTAKLANRISLTVDAYWIQIKNRVVLSKEYNRRNNKALDSILSEYPNLNHINQVSFFSNAINSRTYGIDLILNGFYHFPKSNLRYTLAANFNRTHLFGTIQTPRNIPANDVNTNILFSRADKASIEEGQPGNKITLSMNYQKGKVGFVLTNTRFGRTVVFHEMTPALDEFFSSKILTDISLHYTPKTWLTITLGANNVFNVYPDPLKNYNNTNQGIFIYSPEASPFGFNGGYYFVGVALSF
ncbi:MAG: TonB-dependent receptor [Flavisolibacter sp.]|nr:TonB-dependent receptor [Flavisolibacter sp.]